MLVSIALCILLFKQNENDEINNKANYEGKWNMEEKIRRCDNNQTEGREEMKSDEIKVSAFIHMCVRLFKLRSSSLYKALGRKLGRKKGKVRENHSTSTPV